MNWLTLEEAAHNLPMGTSMPDELAPKGNKLDSSRTTTGAHTRIQQFFQQKSLSQSSRLDVPVSDATRKPKLIDKLCEALHSRHYSRRTEQTYRGWVKRFLYFHNVRHQAEMGEPEINVFLNHLAVKENVSASTQNQALSAILFLYREEVKAVPANLTGDNWLIASLMYGAGLRLMECLQLRVQDIDFPCNEIC